MFTRRQRWWIGGITLFALAAGFIAFSFSGGEKEPFHKGKSLHEWFDSLEPTDMNSGENPNVKAIVAIGSDAVPFLMHELCISESRWAGRLRNLWSQLGLARRPYSSASIRRVKAYYCLIHLGPNADWALPELIKIAEDKSHTSCGLAIGLLGYIRSNPTTVIPVLQKLIADPSAPRFATSINSLSRQGTNARSALPRLKEIELDVGIPVPARIGAARARVLIDPADRQSLEFLVGQWENTNAPRKLILNALNLLGSNALPALPAMRKFAQIESDTDLRSSLSNSIHWLETTSGTEPSHPR